MQSQAPDAASACANVGVETGAISANPQELVAMLFDGVHAALKKAEWAIEQENVALKGEAITKAINIIESGLRAALDAENGGDLAEELDMLYDYMGRTLVRANLDSDASLVAEVDALIENIGSAWKQIGSKMSEAAADA